MAADSEACVLRLAARAGVLGSLALLHQHRGWPACSVAAARAACARKPHCPPWVAHWVAMG